MTEFQRKTYEKLKDHVLSFILDDPEEGTKLTGADIRRLCKIGADALDEKELDALITLAPIDFKRLQVADRMFNLMMQGVNDQKKGE